MVKKKSVGAAPLRRDVLAGLPPVATRTTRVLLLGSFPGAASLAAQQYYAYPQNQFWRLVGDSIGVDLQSLGYARRLAALKRARLGLWDVIGECRRAGSLDMNIRDAVFNDFGALIASCPNLERACFNGKTAAKHVAHVASFGLEVRVLPSSSPANTTRYADKLEVWRAALA